MSKKTNAKPYTSLYAQNKAQEHITHLTRADVLSMSTKQMENTLKSLKRLVSTKQEALEKAHMRYSPSLKGLKKSGFYEKPRKNYAKYNKTTAERWYRGNLSHQLLRGKEFLTRQTSTVEGQLEVNKIVAKRLGIPETQLGERFLSKFWDLYENLESELKALGKLYSSNEMQTDIYQRMSDITSSKDYKDKSWDEKKQAIIDTLKNKINDIKDTKNIEYQKVKNNAFTLGSDNENDEDEAMIRKG